jgi:hypothetical protein
MSMPPQDGDATPNLDAYMRRDGGAPATKEVTPDQDDNDDDSAAFMEEFEGTKSRLSAAEKRNEEQARELADFKKSLKNVVAPDADTEVDEDTQDLKGLEKDLADMMAEFEKAEASGHKMPLTQKLAITSLRSLIKQKKKDIENTKKFANIEARNNPEVMRDNKAFEAMEVILNESVDKLFGEGADMQKQGMIASVAKQVNVEIGRLQKEDPSAWFKVRSNPAMQAKLINYFVEQNVPPKARQIIEEKRLQETPMSTGELWAAFREARDKMSKGPMRDEMMTKLRQDIMAESMGLKSSKRGSIKRYNG